MNKYPQQGWDYTPDGRQRTTVESASAKLLPAVVQDKLDQRLARLLKIVSRL